MSGQILNKDSKRKPPLIESGGFVLGVDFLFLEVGLERQCVFGDDFTNRLRLRSHDE